MITVLTILTFAILLASSYYIGNIIYDSFDEDLFERIKSSFLGLALIVAAISLLFLTVVMYLIIQDIFTKLLS
jgi:hypothetical protein